MSPTSLEERDVPFLDFASPTVAADPFDALRELTKQHWIARTPAGYVLLHHGDCVDVAKDRRFRTPDALGLVAQGVISPSVSTDRAGFRLLGDRP